jgi:hypothetical protein
VKSRIPEGRIRSMSVACQSIEMRCFIEFAAIADDAFLNRVVDLDMNTMSLFFVVLIPNAAK